ncbi:MAG: YtxH domain-containing protein [Anaerolineae bacterium]|nr:YtxH domain-containing protein [Anaerolineae bacterium]
MRVFNFVLGFFGGMIIGAAIVLLTTPQSGDELQAGIRGRLDGIMNEGRAAALARRAELEARLASLTGS